MTEQMNSVMAQKEKEEKNKQMEEKNERTNKEDDIWKEEIRRIEELNNMENEEKQEI